MSRQAASRSEGSTDSYGPEGRSRSSHSTAVSAPRYSVEFDVEGHGLGVLLAAHARRIVRKELPENLQHLKQKLEPS
jgi:hypothetical protein